MTRALTYQGIPLWRHTRIIQWVLQIVSAVIVVTLVVWFFANIAGAINDRNIPYGFSFLSRDYQTPIGEHFIPFEPSDSFGYALFVAATNTILVSIIGVVLATALGVFIGIARLSGNWLVAKLATAYIEFFRNVPLLVQLLFWFYIVLTLPGVRESYVIAETVYVNNAGISVPWLSPTSGAAYVWLAVAVGAVAAGIALHRRLTRREVEAGRASYPFWSGVGTAALISGIAWIAFAASTGAAPFAISVPEPQGTFGRIEGGFTARAGLLALTTGLVMYTAAFIGEIVRAGIQSVSRGQIEAARSLGLSPLEALRRVIFPQALRVIIPPLISQYLNLTKNSSLGGAIGYSDLTSVAITMTQTAPAISIFMLIMAAYLAMSLTWSIVGNFYNRHIRFTGA